MRDCAAAWANREQRTTGGIRLAGLSGGNGDKIATIVESTLLFSTYAEDGVLLTEQRFSFHEAVRARAAIVCVVLCFYFYLFFCARVAPSTIVR